MYYLLFPNLNLRNDFINFLSIHGISATSHYQPLHSSEFGIRLKKFNYDQCPVTSHVSDTIVRLPMYYDMSEKQLDYVIEKIVTFKI